MLISMYFIISGVNILLKNILKNQPNNSFLNPVGFLATQTERSFPNFSNYRSNKLYSCYIVPCILVSISVV